MTIYHQKAIVLKYLGYTHQEISQAIGGRITKGTLDGYFGIGGQLYLPFLQYQSEQDKENDQTIKSIFKSKLKYLWKIKDHILKNALKEKNWDLANKIVNEFMGYAGIVIEQKTVELKPSHDNTPVNYEQLRRDLTERGIDPDTGLRINPTSPGPN